MRTGRLRIAGAPECSHWKVCSRTRPRGRGHCHPTRYRPCLLTPFSGTRATARREALLRILWRERFITRRGLIARVESELGAGCFGGAAWQDTFYRDMRVVKQALATAGYSLAL